MISRIDRVVGGLRAARLINAYRARLRDQDLLPDRAALSVACSAYANGCVYVVAAPGQVWSRISDDKDDPEQLQINEIDYTLLHGHSAICQELSGTVLRMPLDELDARFSLERWPELETD